MTKFFRILLFFLFIFSNIFSVVRDIVESVKVIRVNSIKQKVVNLNTVILQGEVEVLVDQKVHIWADRVEIDKEKQYLIAEKKDRGSVVIENSDFLILADKFFLDLDKKTGYADNIRIHVSEGYIKSGKAEKLKDGSWNMQDMLFTPCDAPTPHWSITARHAKLYSNYVVRVAGVLFKIGRVPAFAVPHMVLPIQNRSKSGFLLPKFSFDDELGFGIREDFYWYIAPRCDSTLGMDWKDKKGVAFSNEFRWVRFIEELTFLNSQFALEKDAFIKKGDTITKGTDQRYWLSAQDYQSFDGTAFGGKLNSLIRIDFGTDKKIGYQFFDNTNNVDDTFYNSLILRADRNKDLISMMLDGSKTSRKQFSDLSNSQVKEILKILPQETTGQGNIFSKKREEEDSVVVCRLPHLELNSGYRDIYNMFFYSQDAFVDRVFSRERMAEKFYVESRLVKEQDLNPLIKADSFRFFYKGDLQTSLKFKDQILSFYLNPNFQVRSNLKKSSTRAKQNALEGRMFTHGAYRAFLEGGVEWALPEVFFEDEQNNYQYYFQSTVGWGFLPKIKQEHWYYSDKWDRAHPKNQLELAFRNNWYFDNVLVDFNISQACDFYNKQDLFVLRQSPGQKYLLPLQLGFSLDCDVLNMQINQEYGWKTFQLLQSEIIFNFSLNRFNLSLGNLYQHAKLQEQRKLFSDIPHFLLLSMSFPIFKNVTLYYDGQFYSEKDSKLFPFEGLRPLVHSVNLEWVGHCWGISLGFEEKRYREYGNWKSENAFTLFVKLESLGSFARKFKRPVAYK
jgi:lipopolysaccharide assembly outer membrane protein LptD (OstA)